MTESATKSEGENVSEIQSLTDRARTLSDAVDFWNSAMIWGLVGAAIAAAVIVIATRLAVTRSKELADTEARLADAKEAKLSLELKDKDREIANAKSEGSKASERAAKAGHEAANANLKAEGFRLDIAKATERAAAANETAERERMARLQLEARLADRVISPAQQAQLTIAFAPLRGKTVEIAVIGGDTMEIARVANSLAESIQRAGVIVTQQWLGGGGTAVTGILVGLKNGAPTEYSKAANAMIGILRETLNGGVGFWDFDKLQLGSGLVQMTRPPEATDNAPLKIFIGHKP